MKIIEKFKSIKLWITIWAMFIISWIIFTKQTGFIEIAAILCSIPLAYCGLNYLQKKLYNSKENTEKSE